MAERMSHFRVKWRRLPAGYAAFVDDNLAPTGTVVMIHDHSIGRSHRSACDTSAKRRSGTRLPRGIWHDRISQRPTTRRRSPSGASIPISAMTCKPGALGAAFAIPRSAMTDGKPPLRRWPRSCATGIALEASQRSVSSFRVSFWATRGKPSAPTAYTTRSPSATDLRTPRPYRKPTTPYRASSCRLATLLEHPVLVGRGLRDDLQHVPVLDHLAVPAEPEDVDPGVLIGPRMGNGH
jgi:hypothetical protein